MTRINRLIAVLLLMPTAASTHLPAAEPGDIIFSADFQDEAAHEPWQGTAQSGVAVVEMDGSRVLAMDRPHASGPGYLSVRVPLPIEAVRGTRLKIEIRAKADAVRRPPNAYNGVKCMLHTVAPSGQKWMQQNNVFGTFDWKTLRFIGAAAPDATEAWIVLGLENTSGRVSFDELKVTLIARRRDPNAVPRAAEPFTGHNLPRLRGAMIGPHVTADDLRELGGKWKANHVRWQLIWGGFPHSPADKATVAQYDAWLESALEHLDRSLPVCREVGLKVLIDIHTPPGGRNENSECRIFHHEEFQTAFLDAWRRIARRYRDEPIVWGYDLMNEPVEGVVGEGLMDWRRLATRAALDIRKIDPHRAVIVEPAPWGSPASLDFFEPIDVPNVVYSVHMYVPHQFTHQGIYGNPTGVQYPGTIARKYYDRAALQRALEPAIAFQRDYGAHIYIGEFSAIRWAPGTSGHDYLSDVIDIMEEHHWDWAYHAFREWDGWSVEHGPNRDDHGRPAEPTDRKQLLLRWFEKNETPK